MAATATSRSTAPARRAPKRAPARSTPRPRRRQNTPIGGFVPVAVGRTAGAVGGIADSGVVVRLTRGRLWIGILAALLVGIVALNVMALSFSASSSEAGRQADILKRQNSAYRAQIAALMSSEQVQQTAGKLGLHIPNPDEIGYLRPSPEDAALAAKRLRAGKLSTSGYVPPAEVPVVPETATPVVAPTEPAPTTDPATVAPATTETAVAPATAAAATATVSGGGVSSP